MRVFITGVCGFVGSSLARVIADRYPDWNLFGCDNFLRSGSQANRLPLEKVGVRVFEADLRDDAFSKSIPSADWVIDCAANPSVLAGTEGASFGKRSSSRNAMEHNLWGTVNLLEYCKERSAGLVMVSTSRVYSVKEMARVPCRVDEERFVPSWDSATTSTSEHEIPRGISQRGISEHFSTEPPLSLYGSSKLASELLAREYSSAFGFPIWIDRCGLMAGAGQFGKADQGIVAYWLHRYLHRRMLKMIGFGGLGHQVRDCLHPRDLWELIERQIAVGTDASKPIVCNASGGIESSFSLAELTRWCGGRWGMPDGKMDGANPERGELDPASVDNASAGKLGGGTRDIRGVVIERDPSTRLYDCPWIVLDSSLAKHCWDWSPRIGLQEIWNEVGDHAESHPEWLALSGE